MEKRVAPNGGSRHLNEQKIEQTMEQRRCYLIELCMFMQFAASAKCKPKQPVDVSQASPMTQLKRDLQIQSTNETLRCTSDSTSPNNTEPSYYFDIEFSYEISENWNEISTSGPLYQYKATEFFKVGNSSKKTGRESKILNKTLGQPSRKKDGQNFELKVREKAETQIYKRPTFVNFEFDIGTKIGNQNARNIFFIKNINVSDESLDNSGKTYALRVLKKINSAFHELA